MVLSVTSCENNPCKNGGTCEYFASAKVHHCFCPESHCGVNCEGDSASPCKNDGTCVYCSAIKKIYCECVGSFTGTHCDVPKTAAKSSSPSFPFYIGIAFFLLLLVVIVIVTLKFVVGERGRVGTKEEGKMNEMDDRVKMEDEAMKEEKKEEQKKEAMKTEEVKTEEEEEKKEEKNKEEEEVKE